MHKKYNKIAYVDFDGTLVNSHCVHYLGQVQASLQHPVLHFFWRIFMRMRTPIFLVLNRISAEKFDRYYYRFFKGIQEKRLDTIVEQRVLDYIYSRYLPDAESRVDALHAAGFKVVLVSGSLKNIVEPFARSIGADACLATELEVVDGVFSGRVTGQSVNYKNKVAAIRHYEAELNEAPQHTLAIGNSKWDIPMLEYVDEAEVVNPDRQLAQWAISRAVVVHNWQHEHIPLRYFILEFFLRPFVSHVEGLHYIPRKRGAILIANHCSYMDHYLIGLSIMCHYRRRARFLAKKEHFEKPFDRWLHEWLGAFPIDRDKADRESLMNVVKLINNGELVLIYPEGTRSLDGKMQPFKPGVLFTQKLSGCEIIPAGIQGSYDVLPSGKLLPRPAKMSVKFGESIQFANDSLSGMSRSETRDFRLAYLHDRVEQLCRECDDDFEPNLRGIYRLLQL